MVQKWYKRSTIYRKVKQMKLICGVGIRIVVTFSCFLFVSLTVLCSIWDLSSQTRDKPRSLCIGNAET